jgi:repressor LexA
MTHRQKEILSFVKEYVSSRGIAPTYDEIGRAFGICKVTVLAHVRQLERKGVLRHQPYAARGIEVCDAAAGYIPVAGVIQAGLPILAVEEADKLNLLDLVPPNETLFSLRVKGDSMVEDHIQDGDFVIARQSSTAKPGDVVVALVDNEEATLKRYYPRGRHVRLEPANAAYEPIVVESERVRIQGVVIGVLRLYR